MEDIHERLKELHGEANAKSGTSDNSEDSKDLAFSQHDAAEQRAMFQAIDSFHQYRALAHDTIHRRRRNLYNLPSQQWQTLARPPFFILDSLSLVDDAIDVNAQLADAIVQVAAANLGFEFNMDTHVSEMPWHGFAKINDHNKAQSTLRQFYRDWSAEGYRNEVKPLLDMILSDLREHLISPSTSSRNIQELPHLLLPGAGLCRLLLELTLRGYNATGNEISYHQLFASNFILNRAPKANCHRLFPFATIFTNTISRADQLRCFKIPDVHPANAIASARAANSEQVGEMSMAAGDFCTSFNDTSSAATFDGVVTAYFIDTAPNLFRYIETVHNCLKPGGLWINVGPLLWHFDNRPLQRLGSERNTFGNEENDIRNESVGGRDTNSDESTDSAVGVGMRPDEDMGIAEPGSFELTHEEVLHLVSMGGFDILSHEILPADFSSGERQSSDRGSFDHGSSAALPSSTTVASAAGTSNGHTDIVGHENNNGLTNDNSHLNLINANSNSASSGSNCNMDGNGNTNGIHHNPSTATASDSDDNPASNKPHGSVGAYLQDPHSMMQHRYKCAHWVARKRIS
jgi:carnosine N-methyltransferase